MKGFLKRFYLFTERIKRIIIALIDRLSAKDIQKSQREYELLYGKELNEKEIIDLKKNAVIRLWKYVAILLIVSILLLAKIV